MGETYNDNPYDILGVSQDATEQEIKTAYRRLALRHHPDRHVDVDAKIKAQDQFSRIANAYQILTDPDLKSQYEASTDCDFDGDNEGFETSGGTGSASTGGARSKSKRPKKPKKFRPKFNDAYEVWKKDFRETFGREYPGAEYDWVDPNSKEAKRIAKNAGKNQKLLKGEEMGAIKAIESDPSLNGKNGGWNPFRRNGKQADKAQNQPSHATTSTAIVPSRNANKSIVKHKKTSTAIVEADDINNRPFYMDVQETKEGPITITKLIMKRPDGSTECCTMRTGIPGPPPRKMLEGPKPKEPLALEGPKSRKMIEGRKEGPAQKSKKKGLLRLTSGKQQKQIVKR